MTDRPKFLDLPSPAPETDASHADVLSQVLALIRLRGERVYQTEMESPWQVRVPAGASHVHFVESGQMRVEPTGAPLQIAKAGDLILLPHGRGHALTGDHSSSPDLVRTRSASERCAP